MSKTTIVYHNPNLKHTYHLLIPSARPGEFNVLLQKNGDGSWSLPHFEPLEHHYAIVQHISDYSKSQWDLELSVLRCFATHADPERGEVRFYAMDNLSPGWAPPEGMQWFSEEALNGITVKEVLQWNVLLDWFDWRHSDSSSRVDWMRPGWFTKIRYWMIDLADRMSMTGIKEPKQVRTWARSATLSLETDDGTLFLKAVPEYFNYEPVITRVLSIRYPERTPDVRAVHVDKGWLLMLKFEGTPLTRINDLDVWKRTVKEFARLQVDMVSNTQSLISLGVPDRNVDYLASQIERLMNDLPDTLTDEEQQSLKGMSSTLRSMCNELVEYKIPLTLTHGDFWSGQVVIKEDGKSLFFDWSDASISHPFFDMCTFLAEVESELPDVPDALQQLTKTYLNEWTRYEVLPNLSRAYELAKVLGYLHQALFYYVHILPRVESAVRWELSGMLTHLLRHVLAEMKALKE